jgi:hypothetical protein
MGFWDFLFKPSGNGFVNNRNFHSTDPEVLKFVTFNEEYASELSSEIHKSDRNNSYYNNGVLLKEVIGTQNMLKLVYNGLLAKKGASEVYAVIGYGDNKNWEETAYFPMNKVDAQSFELVFPVKKAGNINIAFKDSSQDWDNNNGQNYSFSDSTPADVH